ncbi:MAG: hypothetical protein Q4C32_08585 [Eubacteriales bacterium]|nr:hypothetical protein [Eubacteriales bacterium]
MTEVSSNAGHAVQLQKSLSFFPSGLAKSPAVAAPASRPAARAAVLFFSVFYRILYAPVSPPRGYFFNRPRFPGIFIEKAAKPLFRQAKQPTNGGLLCFSYLIPSPAA